MLSSEAIKWLISIYIIKISPGNALKIDTRFLHFSLSNIFIKETEIKVPVICAADMDSSSTGIHGSLLEPLAFPYMSHSCLGLSCNKSSFVLLLCFLLPSTALVTSSSLFFLRPSTNTEVCTGLSLPAVLSRTQQWFSLAFAHQAILGLLTDASLMHNF